MGEVVDELVRRGGWAADLAWWADPAAVAQDAGILERGFRAQCMSRHLDFAARWLQTRGSGYYTIGSAGHESNAYVALALRPTDPALLHYRSGGFYVARCGQVPGSTPISDVLSGVAAGVDDPISGGRHKVFGSLRLAVIPQTSTIGSHLPRAFGLALALERARTLGLESPWPEDAIVVASFGDASVNHSTTLGAVNAASYCASRGLPVPLLLVCEDNGLGISTPTPPGWVERALGHWPGLRYLDADGARPAEVVHRAAEAVDLVRRDRTPAAIRLQTVRFLGHAGSDVELAYRSSTDIRRDHDRDPLIATAATLVSLGAMTVAEAISGYDEAGRQVMAEAEARVGSPTLQSADEVIAPIRLTISARDAAALPASTAAATANWPAASPVAEPLTLAGAINAGLTDILATNPGALVFGEDVAVKGGVYGVTRGLRRRFGGHRVFDTLLDEQTILGTALGAALAGQLPIPEIQYLAYLHNAEDQLRGEAATLAFFSNGQYRNGMVVRVPGFAYQKGFGGHFHNDNSLAVLRDIPGLVVAVPAHPADAGDLLHACVGLAGSHGRVCVLVEPIALYHERDLSPGDGGWLAPYQPASDWREGFGRARRHGSGRDVLIVTFGNGLRMSLLAARALAADGVDCTVLDLRWLAPLPVDDLIQTARGFDRVLIADETRASGGVGEGVLAALVAAGYPGLVRRVASVDSFVPLGPAARLVLLSQGDIEDAAVAMMEHGQIRPG